MLGETGVVSHCRYLYNSLELICMDGIRRIQVLVQIKDEDFIMVTIEELPQVQVQIWLQVQLYTQV